MRSGAAGFTGVPKCAFMPYIDHASSSVWVLPTKAAPASSKASTAGAFACLISLMASAVGQPDPVR